MQREGSSDMEEERLTIDEAYRAMFHFLDAYWQRTQSDDLAGLLGGLSKLPDGCSADPAADKDFLKAVAMARQGAAISLVFR